MNRRELFRRFTGAAAAVGLPAVTVHALDKPVTPNSTLVVLRINGRATIAQFQNLRDLWTRVTHGTDWEGVRAMCCDSDLSIEVHQR